MTTNETSNLPTTDNICDDALQQQHQHPITEASNMTISNSDRQASIDQAARAIRDANYILILAGAGMSADSGLSTYECMPTKYKELCNPIQLILQPETFQQFWWEFATTYARTTPHEGYSILNDWLLSLPSLSSTSSSSSDDGQNESSSSNSLGHSQQLSNLHSTTMQRQQEEQFQGDDDDISKKNEECISDDDRVMNSPCWVYTSNVDGHFRRFSSFQNVICEIHGHGGAFRCANAIGYEQQQQQSATPTTTATTSDGDVHNGRIPRMGDVWKSWNESVPNTPSKSCIDEDLSAILPSECKIDANQSGTNKDGDSNIIRCPHCNLPARPNVLMFHDTDSNILRSIQTQRDRYQAWEAMVEQEVIENGKRLVLLEFGCGMNVPAVREESEEVWGDIWNELLTKRSSTRTDLDHKEGRATLIRINPKDAQIDIPSSLTDHDNNNHDDALVQDHAISIYETSLKALQSINDALLDLQATHNR